MWKILNYLLKIIILKGQILNGFIRIQNDKANVDYDAWRGHASPFERFPPQQQHIRYRYAVAVTSFEYIRPYPIF